MSDYETIVFEQTGQVARITLNRGKVNALNDIMAAELAHAALRCDRSTVRVVVITGAGQYFCAGGDLVAMAAASSARGRYVKAMADDLHRALSTFARMDSIVITAVNGTAAGAGFSLAVAGDLVLAAESASFTMAYTAAGLSPDGSSTFYLPRLIGVRRTQELMLTNRTVSAEQGLQWGLVTEVVSDADLPARMEQLAKQIASGAMKPASAIKNLLSTSFKNGFEEQLELEGRFIAECADSADGQEGITAFLEKRPPDFN